MLANIICCMPGLNIDALTDREDVLFIPEKSFLMQDNGNWKDYLLNEIKINRSNYKLIVINSIDAYLTEVLLNDFSNVKFIVPEPNEKLRFDLYMALVGDGESLVFINKINREFYDILESISKTAGSIFYVENINIIDIEASGLYMFCYGSSDREVIHMSRRKSLANSIWDKAIANYTIADIVHTITLEDYVNRNVDFPIPDNVKSMIGTRLPYNFAELEVRCAALGIDSGAIHESLCKLTEPTVLPEGMRNYIERRERLRLIHASKEVRENLNFNLVDESKVEEAVNAIREVDMREEGTMNVMNQVCAMEDMEIQSIDDIAAPYLKDDRLHVEICHDEVIVTVPNDVSISDVLPDCDAIKVRTPLRRIGDVFITIDDNIRLEGKGTEVTIEKMLDRCALALKADENRMHITNFKFFAKDDYKGDSMLITIRIQHLENIVDICADIVKGAEHLTNVGLSESFQPLSIGYSRNSGLKRKDIQV